MCNFLSALHASQGFETGKSLPKEWDEAVCYFSQVSFSLCTWLVLSLFLFPLLPLCSVPAAQDCVTGTDKVVETLISLSFELPGHSSLFHLETWYRERIPTSVSCKTSRSPGPAIWSQCIEDSAMSQAVWHHCKWEGIVAGDCFERSICCCLQCVSSPTPALGIKFKHCCSLESVRIWLLLSMTAEWAAEAAGADSAPSPRAGWVPWLCGWEGTAPFSHSASHKTVPVTSGSAQQKGSLWVSSILVSWDFWSLSLSCTKATALVPLCIPTLINAAKSI